MRFRQLDGAHAGMCRIPSSEYRNSPNGINTAGSPVLNEAMAIKLKYKDVPTDTGIINGPDFVAGPVEYVTVITDPAEVLDVVYGPLETAVIV